MTQPSSDTQRPWLARFPRSATDKKIGGVAGGLGRALGIDPVLLRVVFLVLTVFGGSGIALYAVAWLLMPSSQGDYSGLEALLGRGSSTMGQATTLALCVVAVIGLGAAFSWGLVLLPVALVLSVLALIAGRKRGWTDKLESDLPWVRTMTDWFQSKFNEMSASSRATGNPPGATGTTVTAVTATEPAHAEPVITQPVNTEPANTEPAPVVPPAWDPLGVAPFAWDLPEPPPSDVVESAPKAARTTSGLAALTIGLALCTGAFAVLGNVNEWWYFSPAQISAAILLLIALSLTIAAIRGRRSRLVGLGIVVSLATIVLSFAGIDSRAPVGQRYWQPATIAEMAYDYRLAVGEGTLDLRAITPSTDKPVYLTARIGIGRLRVLLPADVEAVVICEVRVGDSLCLGNNKHGLNNRTQVETAGSNQPGGIYLTARSGIGHVEVRRG